MANPIRVLCVFSTLDCGGAETMCMNLYRNIDRNLVQFDFVKHTHEHCAYDNEIRDLGGQIFEAPAYRVYNHAQYCIWWHKHLKNHPEHRIIHGHFATIASVYLGIANKYGCITIAHSHFTFSKESVDSVSRFFKWEIMKRTERIAKICFACSREAGAWIFPHRNYHVLNNATDAKKFANNSIVREKVRAELGLSDKLVLGTVGTFKEVKNPFGIIEIVKEVYKRNPNSAFLWVGDGPMRTQIEEKLTQEGMNNSVILTGIRRDVECLMQAMDAFILPSHSEGLPVVVVEAQAAGMRCFLSDVITREADITGRCTYINNTDYVGWAEEICSADLTKVDTYDQICEAGYDVQKSAEWIQEFYLKLSK